MIVWSEKQYQAFLRQIQKPQPTVQAAETPKVEPVLPMPQPIIAEKPRGSIVGKIARYTIAALFFASMGAAINSEFNRPATAQPAVAVQHVNHPTKPHIKKHRVKRHKKKCVCDCNIKVDKPEKPVIVKPSVNDIEERLSNDNSVSIS